MSEWTDERRMAMGLRANSAEAAAAEARARHVDDYLLGRFPSLREPVESGAAENPSEVERLTRKDPDNVQG
jgi:hypothetical protein